MFSIIFFIILLLNIISLGCLIYTTYQTPHSTRRILTKIVSSFLFILLAAMGLYVQTSTHHTTSPYSLYIFTGLIFAAFGDVFLGFADLYSMENNKLFVGGVISFSITHILFSMAFFTLDKHIIPMLLLFPCSIVLLFIFATPKKYFNFYGMKFYVLLYSVIISTMLIISISNVHSLHSFFDYLVIGGTLLFVLSDIILCFIYFFIKKHKCLTTFNLLTYYAAEILLALSLFLSPF